MKMSGGKYGESTLNYLCFDRPLSKMPKNRWTTKKNSISKIIYFEDINNQVPLNIFNQIFLHDLHLKSLKQKVCRMYIRSIFLRGLLLLKNNEISLYFKAFKKQINEWQSFCLERNISLIFASLEFIRTIRYVDVVLIGINSKLQLLKNLKAFEENFNFNFFNSKKT